MKESACGWRPSVEDVAAVKAAAFGKHVYLCTDQEQVMAEREKIPFDQVLIFFTNGGSACFWYNDQYVVLKQAPPGRLRTMDKLTYRAPGAALDLEPDAVPENILEVDFDEKTNQTILFQLRKKSSSSAAILQFPRWLRSTFSWIRSRSRSQITANSK